MVVFITCSYNIEIEDEKEMFMLTALIMAGGSGERFWPLSTKNRPKQLLKLVDDKSMIRKTVERILPMIPKERIFIGTNAIQAPLIAAELPEIPEENIIIEPSFKDTAAAVGFGAYYISERVPNSTLVVLASDHIIKNEENFRKRLETAVKEAEDGSIVTLGIKPNKPETGYGYIETESCYIGEASPVIRFWEKPSLERAEEYVANGNYLWNSGMFIFEISTIKKALQEFLPGHFRVLESMKNEVSEFSGIALCNHVKDKFEIFRKISIDFGIMEKAKNIKVIPVDFGWNDVGSFPALDDIYPHLENGDVVRNCQTFSYNSKNNIIVVDEKIIGKKIVLLGIEDMVVVDRGDALLITKKDENQNIKKVLDRVLE